jgi:excisionase family DNA binding protein
MNEYLTPKEVAAILKVSRLTVYRWIKIGKLESVKIAGIVRIKRIDFEKFIGGKKNESKGK